MNLSEQARRTLPIALLGLLLMATGAAVYVMKVFEAHGRSSAQVPVMIMEDAAAQWMGVSLIFMGLGLMGVLMRSAKWLVIWMTCWMVAAIAIQLIEPRTCTQISAQEKICH